MAKHKLKFGSIVHHPNVPHPNGTPAGPHYVVVLNPQEEIDSGSDLRVAGISTTLTYPLPDGWYELDNTPGKPGGHPNTGLFEACAVKGTWIARLPQSEVENRGKRAPLRTVRKIEDFLARQLAKLRKQKKREQAGS